MDEHDDDLMSEVDEGADMETDSFPDTEDELAELLGGDYEDEQDEDDDDDGDEDKSEL